MGNVIGPGDDLLVDEGGQNAFMPAGFRYHETTDYRTEKARVAFAWGPKGNPHQDRVSTDYEPFVPGQPSSHDSELCSNCKQRKEYLEGVEALHLDAERHERIEELFNSVWMGRSSDADDEESDVESEDEDDADADAEEYDDDTSAAVDADHISAQHGSHSPSQFAPCDGIEDIILTGETDLVHGQVRLQLQII